MTAIEWFMAVAINAFVFGFAAVWSLKVKFAADCFYLLQRGTRAGRTPALPFRGFLVLLAIDA